VKPKILHIQKVKGISGSEKHLVDLLTGLAKVFEIHFLFLEEPSLSQDVYAAFFKDTGVTIHRMAVSGNIDLPLIFRLARFIRMERFDLIHTHLIHADIHGAFAAKLAGVPSVSSKHGWDIYERMNFPQRKLLQLASRLPKAFISISQALVSFVYQYEGVAPEKIKVIPYGLDPVSMAHFPSQIFAESALRLFYLGRLVPEKGVFELIDAMAELKRHGAQIYLDMAGMGPLFEDLKRYIQNKDLGECVQLLGFQTDVMSLLANHHALILPTYGEGFGLVCLEAMAMKRAVLASHVTSLPDIVVDGVTGMLFEARSSQAIVKTVQSLLGQMSTLEKMGEAGYERLLTHFSSKNMIDSTVTFYRQLLQA
jgi:glycosyltransferase involved in cell wall biosynthesis